MNWFGESWGAPACEPQMHVPTPVGHICVECEKPIEDGDAGFVTPFTHGGTTTTACYHRVCFLRTIIPCEMWSGELLADMPERWRAHREEHHGK